MEEKNPAYSVSEVTEIVKKLIEKNLQTIVVEGEVSNFRPATNGHLYFTLKDAGAQIGAVMFRSKAASLSFSLKDGLKVQAEGAIQVYAPQGRYQIVIKNLKIAGEGDILKIIEERKQKLAEEGVFAPDKKKPLPEFPRTVGIITSPTGAAVRDILQIARRRNQNVNVIILPALVQGEEAAKSIAKQIKTANAFSLCDVLIIGRGGGSLEDLLPFSEENVVRAISESKIPTVSAVGHEIDWALSDYAADVRAPTPSAAAELVFPQKAEILEEIDFLQNALLSKIENLIHTMRLSLKAFDSSTLEMRFSSISIPLSAKISLSKKEIEESMKKILFNTRTKIEKAAQTIEDSSPNSILSRGYAVVRKADGNIVRKQSDVSFGEKIEITLMDGKLNAERTK